MDSHQLSIEARRSELSVEKNQTAMRMVSQRGQAMPEVGLGDAVWLTAIPSLSIDSRSSSLSRGQGPDLGSPAAFAMT